MDRTTEFLAGYSCGLDHRDLDAGTVRQVKRTLIDTLGCAAGGFTSEPGKIARQMAASVTSVMPSRVLGTNGYSSPEMAGFANGVMLRYLDCNDSYFSPGGGHPSDMIAGVLALAGPLGSDGRQVITAITLAYEVFCRLSDEVVVGNMGWDQGMFSVIGSACAAGSMLDLDRERMGHAISLAVAPNLPLGVTRTGELSMWKGCATATATRAGIFAALLAEQGMNGPEEPFEGRRGLWEQTVGGDVVLDKMGGDGEPFRITETTFKSYPAQIHTQAPTGLALELRSQVSPADIESILIQAYQGACSSPATEPEKWDPGTRETADHSIPYLVSVALQDGSVTPASFSTSKIHDPAVRSLISRITMEEDPEFSRNYPSEFNVRLRVTDKAGRNYEAHTSYPKGHHRNPMTDAEVEDKFRGLSSGVLSDAQQERTLELAWQLETSDSLDDLMDAMVV